MNDDRTLHDEGMHQDWQGGPEREQAYRELAEEEKKTLLLAQLGECVLDILQGMEVAKANAREFFRSDKESMGVLRMRARALGLLERRWSQEEAEAYKEHERAEKRALAFQELGERMLELPALRWPTEQNREDQGQLCLGFFMGLQDYARSLGLLE